MKRLAFSFWICLSLFLNLSADYVKNPYVDDATWNSIKPHFLPEDLPIKDVLDKIFSKHVLDSVDSLEKAGFKIPRLRKPEKVIVAKHPKLKGYLVKLYTNDNPVVNEWWDWKRRVVGAVYVQNLIQELKYQKFFKVPQKWIYPIPNVRSPAPGVFPKGFVLIVEDMDIQNPFVNERWWKSVAMTPKLMKMVYTLLRTGGLKDSVYPDNLPFSKDRKIAVVDTQHYANWPVPYEKLLPYFTLEQQKYWQYLIDTNGETK